MLKDIFYKQPCKCNNPSCGNEEKIYMWSSKLETFSDTCKVCKTGILHPFTPEKLEIPALIGLHVEKNLSERRVRNHKHFVKEVLPTITDDTAKRHFSNKLKKKL